jgi:thioredoxin-like negative regulator of GroEL
MENLYSITDLDNFICNNIDDSVVMLYFSATWCNPCNELKKRLLEASTLEIMPKLKIGYIDIDNHSDNLVERYKINILPSQILVKINKNDIIQFAKIEGSDMIRLKIEYDKYLKN